MGLRGQFRRALGDGPSGFFILFFLYSVIFACSIIHPVMSCLDLYTCICIEDVLNV